MQISLATALVAAASLVQASALVERNLADCGEHGPCVTGASCVNNFCICGNGWMADPNLLPNSALAGYRSCIDHDECLIPSDNVCADKASGGVCVDWNPPVKYQCSCDTNRGFIPTEMDPVFGATACENVNFFQRASVFKICEQMDKKCDTDAEIVAKIITTSEDGYDLDLHGL